MNNKLTIYLFGAVFTALCLYVVSTLTSGMGMAQILRTTMALIPVFVVSMIAARRYWLPLLLVFWTISMRLPVLLFDSITVGFIIIVFIGGLFVLERLMMQKPLLTLDRQTTLLLLAGVIILVRLLIDRPGSARMGGTGGLRHAVTYAAAVPLFFLTDQLAREPFNARRVFRAVILLSFLMLIWSAVWRLILVRGVPIYFGWYEGAAWFLMPLVLAWLLRRVHVRKLSLALPLLFTVFYLALSILSPFRSRLYFAVASISAVFWCFGYRRKLLIALAILFCMAIPLLTIMPRQWVPVVARRALSTLLPFDRGVTADLHERGIAASGEMGWTSEFRRSMMDKALLNIRAKPFFGQGWVFSADELIWAASFSQVNWAASSLITAGDYHNSLVTVAVKCGLIAAVSFGVALFTLLWRAGMCEYRGDDDYFLALYAGLMGALVAIFGQMLMNGSGQDLQAICAILGFQFGVRGRFADTGKNP